MRQNVVSYVVRSAVLSIVAFFGYTERCSASFELGYASGYGVIYETTSVQTFAPANSSLNGDVGIVLGGRLAGTGTSIAGNIDFSAAYNGVPNQQYNPAGLTVTPSPYDPDGSPPQYSVFNLQNSVLNGNSAVNSVNSLSYTFGQEAGQPVALGPNAGETLAINASSGFSDGQGDSVFTITNLADFTNGETLTITGDRSSFVVFNVAAPVATNGLNGNITLVGIPSDQVVFNFTPDPSNSSAYGAAYGNLTGGPTMTINGVTHTAGVFLDPTGNFSVSNSTIDGRIIGGGDSTFSSSALYAPEPSSLGLAALGVLCLGTWGRATRAARSRRSAPAAG